MNTASTRRCEFARFETPQRTCVERDALGMCDVCALALAQGETPVAVMSDEPQPRERPKSGAVKWAEREAEQYQRNADGVQLHINASQWWQFAVRRELRKRQARCQAQADKYAQLAIDYVASFDRTDP